MSKMNRFQSSALMGSVQCTHLCNPVCICAYVICRVARKQLVVRDGEGLSAHRGAPGPRSPHPSLVPRVQVSGAHGTPVGAERCVGGLCDDSHCHLPREDMSL